MQLKKDNNDNSNNSNYNYNNDIINPHPYRSPEASFEPEDFVNKKTDFFEDHHKISVGSRNIIFSIRSLVILAFIIVYVAIVIPLFNITIKKNSTTVKDETLTTEGYVKYVTCEKKSVTQNSGTVTVTSNEDVYTATYEFEVNGKRYSGEYESLDEIKPNTKIDVVYNTQNPSENHRRSASEAASLKVDNHSKNWFAFILAALLIAFIMFGSYLRIRCFITGRFPF